MLVAGLRYSGLISSCWNMGTWKVSIEYSFSVPGRANIGSIIPYSVPRKALLRALECPTARPCKFRCTGRDDQKVYRSESLHIEQPRTLPKGLKYPNMGYIWFLY